MNIVRTKEIKIRNLVNQTWKIERLLKDKVKWNKLCSSMDVIGDTQIAIDSYFTLPSFNAEKGGYLFLYGLLQAFFLQQDAVNNLSDAILGKAINWQDEYPDIYLTRELRNDSIGHPTKRGNNESFHFIARYSISKEQFQLMSCYPKNNHTKFKEIDINELRKKQENSVIQILDNVIKLMRKEYNEHKTNFSKIKLIDLIPGTMNYSISKIYEGIYNNYPLAEMNFSLIKETIDSIKGEIIKRYTKLSALPGIDDTLRKIDHIIQKLDRWITDSELYNNSDAEIFLDSFSEKFGELEKMLKEIDKEFEQI